MKRDVQAPLPNAKLRTLEAAAAYREELRRQGRKVVLTNGVFDLLHTGHLFYLQKARSLGDALFVALNADQSVRQIKGPLRPVQGERERAYALGALSCTDCIVLFGSARLDAEILALQPDIYCKAGDYSLGKLDSGERDALEKVSAKIEFLPFLPGFSTTQLLARIRAAGSV